MKEENYDFYSKVNGFYNNKTKKPIEPEEPEIDIPEEYEEVEEPKSSKSGLIVLLSIIAIFILIEGIFFMWSVYNDKFKAEVNECPVIPEFPVCPTLSCPSVNVPQSVCNCNQNLTCPNLNITQLIKSLVNITGNNS